MEIFQDSDSKFDRLRRQAEELIRHKENFDITSPSDIFELIQELKIYQAELEIQNEELKRAQQELSELHREYKRLYEYAPCGYITLDAKGLITHVNLTAVKLLGKPKKHLLQSGLNLYISNGWQDLYITRRIKAAQTGENQNVELLLKRKNVPHLWVRADIQADRDENDAVLQWSIILLDITPEKEVKTALSQSRDRFHTLFENTPIACQSIDAEGNILLVNTAWEEMLGYAKKDVIGKSFSQFILPKMRPCFKKQFPKQRSLQEILGNEFILLKKNGDQILAAYKGKAGVDSLGNFTQTHGVLQDITSQRKAEEDRQRLEDQLRYAQKMETIGILAGGVAHDFNNLLAIIMGNYELIKDELPQRSPLKENLEQIHLAVTRAGDVVRQLLTFARQSDTNRTPVNIAAVVKESLRLIRSTTPTNIEIRKNLPEETLSVLGNSTQINQLIINLCANAADAMLPAGGDLTLAVENVSMDEAEAQLTRTLKPGLHVKIVIKDTGCGMDAKTLEHIFEPYFTTKPFGKGTGIGLAVVHGIVDQHKGEIFVESEVGQGTSFTVLLPAFQDRVQEKEVDDIELPKGNESILFVDDEPSIVKLTRVRLSFLGYGVTCATDSLKALEMVKADPAAFDLVITDMAMPHMTGDVLSLELLSVRPDLPIILCTGYSESISEERARKIGISGFLMKPTNMTDFAVTVRKALDKSRK